MPSLSTSLRRAPRTLMFWLIVAILAVGVLRAFFPRGGFDEVRTGDIPLEVAGSDDGVWVLNYGDESVSLVRPSDQEVLHTTDVGDELAPVLSANDDGAWILLDGGETLARVDPDSGDVVDRVDLTGAVERGQDVAAGDGFLWVTSGEGGEMVRVEEDGTVGEPIDLGESVVQPQILDDELWVYETSGLGEYDVESGEQIDLVPVDFEIHDFVATDDALWLLADIDDFEQTGVVVRVDPEGEEDDGQPRVRLTGARPARIAVQDDQIFVSASGGLLFEIGTEPLAVTATEQVTVSSKNLHGLIVHDDVIWIADGLDGVVHQPIDGIQGEIVTTETTVIPA